VDRQITGLISKPVFFFSFKYHFSFSISYYEKHCLLDSVIKGTMRKTVTRQTYSMKASTPTPQMSAATPTFSPATFSGAVNKYVTARKFNRRHSCVRRTNKNSYNKMHKRRSPTKKTSPIRMSIHGDTHRYL